MSRSGYSEECDGWDLIRWRGAVNSAIRGKRGQSLLRELATAMDAMPEKRLIANSLVTPDGEFCALGVVGSHRGIDMSDIELEDADEVAGLFDIAPALAKEIVFMNDEYWDDYSSSPEQRWVRMRKWVDKQIAKGDPFKEVRHD